MSGDEFLGWLLTFVIGLALGFCAAGAMFDRPNYERGWCNAQSARYVGNGYCVTEDGRAIATPEGR